jgi:D-glycero-D-manno-heptose 1,7-bisphosphate phosphatase
MARAVFLDRDGVVNELFYHQELEIRGAPFTVNQFKLISGVPEAINLLHRSGYLVVLISNQPDTAKGRVTLDSFEKIRLKMKAELAKAGAYLDGEYYCMHHPEAVVEQFKVICDCRKPKSGLLLRAARELDVDMPQSWFVGDNLSDVEAGKGTGCRTVLIGKMKCELCDLMDNRNVMPDSKSTSLTDAVQHILKTRI